MVWVSNSGLSDLSNRLAMVVGSGGGGGEVVGGSFGRILKLVSFEVLSAKFIMGFDIHEGSKD